MNQQKIFNIKFNLKAAFRDIIIAADTKEEAEKKLKQMYQYQLLDLVNHGEGCMAFGDPENIVVEEAPSIQCPKCHGHIWHHSDVLGEICPICHFEFGGNEDDEENFVEITPEEISNILKED